MTPTTLNQPVTENLGIRTRILDFLFIEETKTKNTKNLHGMGVKPRNIILSFIKTVSRITLSQVQYHA